VVVVFLVVVTVVVPPLVMVSVAVPDFRMLLQKIRASEVCPSNASRPHCSTALRKWILQCEEQSAIYHQDIAVYEKQQHQRSQQVLLQIQRRTSCCRRRDLAIKSFWEHADTKVEAGRSLPTGEDSYL
jgi:hypothetical protein